MIARQWVTLAIATAVSTAAMLFLMATGLHAAPKKRVTTYPPQVEEQCHDDYFRHCSPYALGSDELRRCMEAKGRNLSPNCRQALKDAGYVKSSKR